MTTLRKLLAPVSNHVDCFVNDQIAYLTTDNYKVTAEFYSDGDWYLSTKGTEEWEPDQSLTLDSDGEVGWNNESELPADAERAIAELRKLVALITVPEYRKQVDAFKET